MAVASHSKAPRIYDDVFAAEYMRRDNGSLPAHPFQVGTSAHTTLLGKYGKCAQSIVFTGESGSGKTAHAKIMMRHLSCLGSGHYSHRQTHRVTRRRHSVVTNDMQTDMMGGMAKSVVESNIIFGVFFADGVENMIQTC